MTQTSFYSDTPNFATDFPTQNDGTPTTGNTPAPSSFYPNGGAYVPLAVAGDILSEVQALVAQADADVASAASSAAAAAASAAAAATAGSAGTITPLVDGTAAVGVSPKWAHEDHVHPTDTSRADAAATTAALALKAPLASPALTGAPTAPTATVGTNTTQLATTAFVQSALPVVPAAATATPIVDGTAAVGVATKYAREDHVHPAPPFSSITSKPTTVAGYGITDALTSASFPAWSAYTVTIGGLTGGTATAAGRFLKIGKLVFVTIIADITSTAAGTLTFSLPATSFGAVSLAAKETSLTGFGGTAFAPNSATIVLLLKDDGTQFTTNGMHILISGTYESQ